MIYLYQDSDEGNFSSLNTRKSKCHSINYGQGKGWRSTHSQFYSELGEIKLRSERVKYHPRPILIGQDHPCVI